jgi:hypothetical protein
MVGVLEKKPLQSPPRLSYTFSRMRPKIIIFRTITISLVRGVILKIKGLV